MLTMSERNVNKVFPIAMLFLYGSAKAVSSRGMATLEYETPVCTEYRFPTERVIFIPERDANPFFHFMESLWILAGRKDVEWLAWYNDGMRQYSDNGKTFHAAYGYRLRHQQCVDQLEQVIDLLKKEPDTRRAVLQIWDAFADLNQDSKDIPCNDTIFFKIRDNKLNMMVCNRSNDVIWGAYGANVVHFSVLQEYIAGMVGVEVGVYRQVSDSFHVYTDNPQWEKLKNTSLTVMDPYTEGLVDPYPLINDPEGFDADLKLFMHWTENSGKHVYPVFKNSFFDEVAIPMWVTWWAHKSGDRNGLNYVNKIMATDWHLACHQWLEKREN